MNTITRDYVLLALAREIDLNSFIRVSNFMGTVAGGVYELEQKNVIELKRIQPEGIGKLLSGDFAIQVKTDLPSELSYLRVLYKVMKQSEKKTMHDVVKMMSFDIKTQYSETYIADLVGSLVADKIVTEEKKKGLLGKEKILYKTSQDCIKKMVQDMYAAIKNDAANEHDLLLLYLLMKTDMLDEFYSSSERALVQDKLEEFKKSDNAAKDVLQVMDDIVLILFGILALLG